MATSAARKTAPAAKSPAARPRKAAAPKARAPQRTAKADSAAPLDDARAAVEPAAAEPKKARPKQAGTQGAAEPKRLKLVRDSFTLPKVEYGVIGVLKTRAARLGRPSKKSEIVRAGVKALERMTDAEFLACVSALPAGKPARTVKD